MATRYSKRLMVLADAFLEKGMALEYGLNADIAEEDIFVFQSDDSQNVSYCQVYPYWVRILENGEVVDSWVCSDLKTIFVEANKRLAAS